MIGKKQILTGLKTRLSELYSRKSYFLAHETACPCCNKNDIDPIALTRLNIAREILGQPINLNSAFRCKKHNKSLKKSSPTSSHLKGVAFDIRVRDNSYRFDLIEALIFAGFKRILIYKGFVHADLDQDKPRVLKTK